MTEKPNKNDLERFHQHLVDIDFQFSEYTWNNFVNGKVNVLCGQYAIWQREDAKEQEERAYKEKLERLYVEGGNTKVIAALDKELERERTKLQWCKSLTERETISDRIATILHHRAAVKEQIEQQAERTRIEYEREEQARWDYPIKIRAVPVLSVILAVVLLIPPFFLIYWICAGQCRFVCTFLLLMYSAILLAIAVQGDNKIPYLNETTQNCISWAFMAMAIVGMITVVLVPLGYIWYYICGGFLLFPDDAGLYEPEISDYIFILPLSIFLLIYLVGGGILLFKK